MKLCRPLAALFCALALSWSTAKAGEIAGGHYSAGRFGKFEISAAEGDWVILDREAVSDNNYGGPLVEFKATRAAGSIYPLLMISAYRRASEEVTADFLLRTSRDAMLQKGAQPGPVLVQMLGGRKVRYFETAVTQKGQPATLYYVLLEGSDALFAAQVVAPPEDMPAVKKQVDQLLQAARY